MLRGLAVALGAAFVFPPPLPAGTVRDPLQIDHFVRLGFPHATVRRSSINAWTQEFAGTRVSDYFRQNSHYVEVIGQPEPDESGNATSVVDDLPPSHRRLAQVKVVSSSIGRNPHPVYVAFFNYTFLDITRCNQCASLAKIAMFQQTGETWQAEIKPLLGPNTAINTAAFTDLTGDGIRELLVEVGSGVNAVSETTLHVFDIANQTLVPLCEVPIRYDSTNSGFDAVKFEKKLDVAKTRATGGRHLVFRVTTFTHDRALLPVPRITEEKVATKNTPPRR